MSCDYTYIHHLLCESFSACSSAFFSVPFLVFFCLEQEINQIMLFYILSCAYLLNRKRWISDDSGQFGRVYRGSPPKQESLAHDALVLWCRSVISLILLDDPRGNTQARICLTTMRTRRTGRVGWMSCFRIRQSLPLWDGVSAPRAGLGSDRLRTRRELPRCTWSCRSGWRLR